LGVDHELVQDFKVGLQLIFKQNKNIVEDVDKNNGYDPNATDDQGRPIWLPYDFVDPGFDGEWGTDDDQNMTVYGLAEYAPTRTYEGANPPEAKREYRAVVLTFDKRMTGGWSLQGSVLYSAFKGNADPGYSATEGESGAFDNPNQMINSWGRVAFDRPWQVKLMGSILLPGDIIFTGYFQHRSGSAWARTLSRVYFPSSIDTQDSYASSVWAETNGTRRNPPYTMFDMRLEKTFDFGDVAKLGLIMDIFNLFGRSGYNVSQNPNPYLYPYRDPPEIRLDTDYGLITSAYGIRSIRFGVRFTF
jgi:hypothetical protein